MALKLIQKIYDNWSENIMITGPKMIRLFHGPRTRCHNIFGPVCVQLFVEFKIPFESDHFHFSWLLGILEYNFGNFQEPFHFLCQLMFSDNTRHQKA